jgi:hypothetical protein
MKKLLTVGTICLILAAMVFASNAVRVTAADHLDGPLVKSDGRFDITDLYVYQSPTNKHNTVFTLNVDPGAGVLSPTVFGSDGKYIINIDPDQDADADMQIVATFTKPDSHGSQRVTLSGNFVSGQGKTGEVINLDGGAKLFAGLKDDPFFFDLDAFHNNLQFCPGGVGHDFFKGLNVSTIVVEVPNSMLTSGHKSSASEDSDSNETMQSSSAVKIDVWARTIRSGSNFDRMGRPAINTVFIPPDQKDTYNLASPAEDQQNFRSDVVSTLLALGNDSTRANALADFLLPDVLNYDSSKATAFPNGRKLTDDVIDTELSLITNGKVPSDCVSNDSDFVNHFPYLAPAN